MATAALTTGLLSLETVAAGACSIRHVASRPVENRSFAVVRFFRKQDALDVVMSVPRGPTGRGQLKYIVSRKRICAPGDKPFDSLQASMPCRPMQRGRANTGEIRAGGLQVNIQALVQQVFNDVRLAIDGGNEKGAIHGALGIVTQVIGPLIVRQVGTSRHRLQRRRAPEACPLVQRRPTRNWGDSPAQTFQQHSRYGPRSSATVKASMPWSSLALVDDAPDRSSDLVNSRP